MPKSKTAIVAAMEREIRPLVASWVVVRRSYEGREFKFFEDAEVVAVCGGIGPVAARRACQAVFALYSPEVVISVGFAGALTSDLHAGDVVVPAKVTDSGDGSNTVTGAGVGTLVSAAAIANPGQKRVLAEKYQAVAVDMEAAAVAKGAQACGMRFAAVKVISDELDFEIPVVEGSVDSAGQFHEGRFLAGIALRPWIWGRVARMARNSSLAAENLAAELRVRVEEFSSRALTGVPTVPVAQ